MSGQERRTLPLPGPLDEMPLSAFTAAQAAEMLDHALTGLPVGDFDREIVDWLTSLDTRAVVVVASLLRRAFEAGTAAGRAERVDELPTVEALRAQARTLARQLEAARATVEQVNGWWRDAQAERDEAREDVEQLEAASARSTSTEGRWLDLMDVLRVEAEQRHGVAAGDMAVVEDPVYGPALDAWQAWKATAETGGTR